MMPYKVWLDDIIDATQDIASRDFQEEAWFPGGKVVSSPDEIYQTLMEDSTPDLFFETYGKTFTTSQLQGWNELRSLLEQYYTQIPLHPDPRRVLDDPEWDLVRQAAKRFVRAFSSEGAEQ
ncbi:MAG: hypothetical protein ABSG32_09195 [Terriglobia bacterium]|jgi:hypothetical protein